MILSNNTANTGTILPHRNFFFPGTLNILAFLAGVLLLLGLSPACTPLRAAEIRFGTGGGVSLWSPVEASLEFIGLEASQPLDGQGAKASYKINITALQGPGAEKISAASLRCLPSQGVFVQEEQDKLLSLSEGSVSVTCSLILPRGRSDISWRITPLAQGEPAGEPIYLYAALVLENDGTCTQVPYGPASALLRATETQSMVPASSSRVSLLSTDPQGVEGSSVFSVTGQLTYWNDNESVSKPMAGVTVQLYDSDSGSSEDLLGTYETDSNGYYAFNSIAFADADDLTPGTPDIFIRATFTREEFYVTDNSGTTYQLDSSINWDISAGSYTINMDLGSSNSSRALGHVFSAMQKGVAYASQMGASRKSIRVIWPSTESTNYVYGYQLPAGTIVSEKINIASSSQWSLSSMLHEYGHSVMMALCSFNYNNWPTESGAVDPSPHYVNSASNGAFALAEGFAEFFSCAATDSALSLLQYSNATTPNAESNEWWKGRDGTNTDGAIVEGSVASALWDMVDTASSTDNITGDDDSMSVSSSLIANVIRNSYPNNIGEFWNGWLALSYSNVTEMAAIFAAHHISVSLPANNKPTVMVIAPATAGIVATNSFTVTWNSYDADGDTLLVDIYSDLDTNSDNGMTNLASSLENTGSWNWNLSNVSAGTYWIYVVVKDNKGGQGGDYSSGTLLVNYNSNPPVIDPAVPSLSALAGQPIRYDLTPHEGDAEDGDESESLTWAVTDLSSDVSVTGQGSADDILTFTPASSFTGVRRCTLVLTDSGGRYSSQYLYLLWVQGTASSFTPASASADPAGVSGYGAEKLIDGSMSYQADFATRITGTSATVILDLGGDRILSGVNITNDGQYGAAKVAVSIAQSSDSTTFSTAVSYDGLSRVAEVPSTTGISFTPFLHGRYMKLVFSGFDSSSWFQLNEIAPLGWEASATGSRDIVSIVSSPAAYPGAGTDKLYDGLTVSNGDYAVLHAGATVELTVDLGQDTSVLGFESVNDGQYGARSLRVYGVTNESNVLLGVYENLPWENATPTSFSGWFTPGTYRTLVFDYYNFNNATYFQLNELKVIGPGGTTTGDVQIDPVNLTSSIAPFTGYGVDKLTDGLKVHNGDFAAKKGSAELTLTFDFGADKTISSIRHYNDGQYGATALVLEYATAAAPSTFTSVGTFTSLNVTSGTPNLDTLTFSSVKGRYFRIRYTSGNDPVWLQLNEITFFGPSGQGSGSQGQIKPVSSTSSPQGLSGYLASRLIDGIRVYNGDFAVKNQGAQVAITLDLGSDQDFSALRVYNDGLYGARSLQVATALSATSTTYTDLGTFTGLSAVSGSPAANDISLPGSRGRYIRITALTFYDAAWFQLNEIEVYTGALQTVTKFTPQGATCNLTAWPGYGVDTLYNGVRTFNGDFACNNAGAKTTITFDLGADRDVASLVHVNDGQFGANSVTVKYARDASPDVFISLGTFSDLYTTAGSPNENVLDVTDFTGRYVRLEYTSFADTGWLQLNEVEFIAQTSSSSSAPLLESSEFISASAQEEIFSGIEQFQGQASLVQYEPRSGDPEDLQAAEGLSKFDSLDPVIQLSMFMGLDPAEIEMVNWDFSDLSANCRSQARVLLLVFRPQSGASELLENLPELSEKQLAWLALLRVCGKILVLAPLGQEPVFRVIPPVGPEFTKFSSEKDNFAPSALVEAAGILTRELQADPAWQAVRLQEAGDILADQALDYTPLQEILDGLFQSSSREAEEQLMSFWTKVFHNLYGQQEILGICEDFAAVRGDSSLKLQMARALAGLFLSLTRER